MDAKRAEIISHKSKSSEKFTTISTLSMTVTQVKSKLSGKNYIFLFLVCLSIVNAFDAVLQLPVAYVPYKFFK